MKAIYKNSEGKSVTAVYVEAERNVDGRLIARGSLKRGLKIGTEIHREFELREPVTGDLLAAELDARMETVLNFNAEVLVRQFVKLGSYEGPFTTGLLSELRPYDFQTLRAAQMEIDALGEVIK